MRIKFLQNINGFIAGSVAEVLPKAAQKLIDEGKAEAVNPYTVCMQDPTPYVGCNVPATTELKAEKSKRSTPPPPAGKDDLDGMDKDDYAKKFGQ